MASENADFWLALCTIWSILSLAWQPSLLPPKLLGVVSVVATHAFWISLVGHFQDEETSGQGR